MSKKLFTLLREGSTTPVFEVLADGTINSTHLTVTASGAVQYNANLVTAGDATLAVNPVLHTGKVIRLARAAGVAVTLPVPTGSGNIYRFVVGTTVTSNSITIKVPSAAEIIQGVAVTSADDSASAVKAWATAADTDTITLNGGTTGGFIGDYIELVDLTSTTYAITNLVTKSTGTEATPFSATVS